MILSHANKGLVASNADKRVEVAAEGGIGAILLAMRGHPTSAKLQRRAARRCRI
jgi:hypothetical protein